MIKIAITLMFALYATSSSAQSLQESCDVIANNARHMYMDVHSSQYASGEFTYNKLINNYAGQGSQLSMAVAVFQKQLLDDIIARRDFTAQTVNDYVYQ